MVAKLSEDDASRTSQSHAKKTKTTIVSSVVKMDTPWTRADMDRRFSAIRAIVLVTRESSVISTRNSAKKSQPPYIKLKRH